VIKRRYAHQRGWSLAVVVGLGDIALQGCAQHPRLTPMSAPGTASVSQREDATTTALPSRWSGRLVLKLAPFGAEPAQGVNVAFDVQGIPKEGQLDLSTPMGTLIAQVRWQQALATLTTADGAQAYDSLDALTQRALGESLPVTAMLSWLQGHPAADQPWRPASASSAPTSASPEQFTQAGWEVDLSALGQGTLLAQRPATEQRRGVSLRVRLDR
jgi:outer membrane lipoprotein LolB